MSAMWFVDRGLIPDALLRAGIRRLLARRLEGERRKEAVSGDPVGDFMKELTSSRIAVHTKAANEQHYEVPTDYFKAVLGPHRKYSCCLWEDGARDLATAEERMLELTCERAGLANGQDVLDLGCGWGSFCLYAAEKYPGARFTAVSNSRTQRACIEADAAARGIRNLTVITRDVNEFAPETRFDRIVSVEMLEHVRNYEVLFGRIRNWLKPDGRMFVHIFCHDRYAYPFEVDGDRDWMAKHFFTGGVMPSADLLTRFNRDLVCVQQWKVNGIHYAKTLEAWLERMDDRKAELMPLFRQTYGAEARKWWEYWRLFYLACSELFAYRGGDEWYVSHYVFTPRP